MKGVFNISERDPQTKTWEGSSKSPDLAPPGLAVALADLIGALSSYVGATRSSQTQWPGTYLGFGQGGGGGAEV